MAHEPFPLRVGILGSGRGSTAEAILARQRERKDCSYAVTLVISTRSDAGIVDIGKKYGVQTEVVNGKDANAMEEQILGLIQSYGVQLLVLAGFMKLLPASVITAMGGRIINIHPALLPRHGGKGMYGKKVHEAVVASGDLESGATVHWVNEHYDEGAIIAQRTIRVGQADTAEDVERNVRSVERELLPDVVEHLGAMYRSSEHQELWKIGRVTFSRE